jgi:hypothetical protein
MSEESDSKYGWLKSIGTVLSIIAGIVVALAKIGQNGETAFATALQIFMFTGAFAIGFTLFAAWFAPFFYFNNKFVALLASVAIFLGEGFVSRAVFGDFEHQMRTGFTPLQSAVFGGIGTVIWVSGLHSLAKKYQVL